MKYKYIYYCSVSKQSAGVHYLISNDDMKVCEFYGTPNEARLFNEFLNRTSEYHVYRVRITEKENEK